MAARQIANLQGLRGIAAFLVLLYHVQPMLNRVYGLSLDSNFGLYGVDIFFVLSGFVMFYCNREPQSASAPRFLVHRFFRIVPLYWLSTLAIIAFFLIGFRPVGLHLLSPTIVAQSLAFIPSAFPDGRHDLILTLGWTLMFELFFYLAFALTFPLRSLEKSFAVLASLFILLSAAGQLIGPAPYLVYFYTSPIMLEFLYGAAIGILYLRWQRAEPAWLPLAGVALLVLGFAIPLGQDFAGLPVPNKHDARFLVLGLPALLVVAGALAMERGGWILKQRFLLELGAASYVLYLFHLLFLQMAFKAAHPFLPEAPILAGALVICACVAGAFIIHYWIEKPILKASHRLTRPASRSPQVAMPEAAATPALAIQPAK